MTTDTKTFWNKQIGCLRIASDNRSRFAELLAVGGTAERFNNEVAVFSVEPSGIAEDVESFASVASAQHDGRVNALAVCSMHFLTTDLPRRPTNL